MIYNNEWDYENQDYLREQYEKKMRGEKPFIFTNCFTGEGIDQLVNLIRRNALFEQTEQAKQTTEV